MNARRARTRQTSAKHPVRRPVAGRSRKPAAPGGRPVRLPTPDDLSALAVLLSRGGTDAHLARAARVIRRERVGLLDLLDHPRINDEAGFVVVLGAMPPVLASRWCSCVVGRVLDRELLRYHPGLTPETMACAQAVRLVSHAGATGSVRELIAHTEAARRSTANHLGIHRGEIETVIACARASASAITARKIPPTLMPAAWANHPARRALVADMLLAASAARETRWTNYYGELRRQRDDLRVLIASAVRGGVTR